MSDSGKTGMWVTGGAVILLSVISLAAVVGARGWSSFVSYGISTDLTDYYVMVESSDLESEPKRELLNMIDGLRDKARKKSVGFFRWLSYDKSIRSMIEDRRISPQERELIKREFERLEMEFE